MSEYVFPPQPQPSVAVAGSEARFPLRRIFCVGRNYAEHAREMGHDPDREPPFFFDKPIDTIAEEGDAIPYPPATADLHHEGELVVALGKGGVDIPEDAALDCVWGYAAGIDLTRRDVQAEAKKKGRPWTMAKGFDYSAVCGPVHPVAETGHLDKGGLRLSVNGGERQNGDLADMIWSVPEVISYLSGLVELKAGDLIYTGTPAGVSALERGDTCVVEIDGLAPLRISIA